MVTTSSFLTPGTHAAEDQLASLYLRRDQCIPVILSTTARTSEDEGYAEGVVTNTRFGSFPHSTVIGAPWGTQIRASKVDTGSRGRVGAAQGGVARLQNQSQGKGKGTKRKADAISGGGDGGGENGESQLTSGVSTPGATSAQLKEAVLAASGFVHVLQPTPESWTQSLPHRTQVVYTPDYSYILHRIRARPGSVLIEAGSGSGSFTHAAARAVFNGYPDDKIVEGVNGEMNGVEEKSRGKVFTYEFHAERHRKVKQEMNEHGLDSIVRATHRDVYRDGFLLQDGDSEVLTSPQANAVFLDLPAPWEALQHLTRESKDGRPSALSSSSTIHICTFSPCIEQVQKTISFLRRYGWLEIEMVEIQHKRIDIRRDFTGLKYDGMRGVNAMPVDVDEALEKLREVEQRAQDFHAGAKDKAGSNKMVRVSNQQQDASKTLYKEGRLVHRSEPELKTHTSHLVFAVLPREWTEEDEEREREKWSRPIKIEGTAPKSQRQLKKESKQRTRNPGGSKTNTNGVIQESLHPDQSR